MPLELESFSEGVATVLADYPNLELPLLKSDLRPHSQLESIARQPSTDLFPAARDPESAHSGLLLLLGGWHQSHEVAQDITRTEGSYWHAITHRVEPDFSNAGYWFRQVGAHPVFKGLRQGATAILRQHPDTRWDIPDPWDPFAFLNFCERSIAEKNGERYRATVAIHSLEWRLLFEWCAARTND